MEQVHQYALNAVLLCALLQDHLLVLVRLPRMCQCAEHLDKQVVALGLDAWGQAVALVLMEYA